MSNEIEEVKKSTNKETVRLHNSFINAIFSLSADAKKILLIVWLHSKPEETNIVKVYQKDIEEKIGLDIMHLNKEHREQIIDELMKKIITIRDINNPNNFIKFSLFRDTEYKDGLLTVDLSHKILPYIKEAQEKLFTRFKIQNIKPLTSIYAIRIYLLLKQFEDTSWRTISIEEFKKMLEIENKYKRTNDLKRRVLEPAQRQINENTDLKIKYELIKKGKKYTHIKFLIKKKREKRNNYSVEKVSKLSQEKDSNFYGVNNTKTETKNQLPAPTQTQNKKLEILKQKIKTNEIKSLKELSAYLQKLKNVNITNAIYDENFYSLTFKLIRINEFGMIELDGEEVDRETANFIRRILYQNPDLIGKFVNIDNELEELKDKFINKVWVFMQNGFYYAVGVKDIIRENQNIVKVTGIELLREKDFEIKVIIDFLKTQSPKDKLSLADKDYYTQYNYIREKEMQEQEKN